MGGKNPGKSNFEFFVVKQKQWDEKLSGRVFLVAWVAGVGQEIRFGWVHKIFNGVVYNLGGGLRGRVMDPTRKMSNGPW